METRDHLRLANHLLAQKRDRLPHGFAAGFRIGSVLPDCNPFTYLSGVRCRQGLHGHHAEVTKEKICKLLSKAKRANGSGFLPGLRTGTALHYLADAFTYPHHAYYPGSISDHVAYEASLHRIFLSDPDAMRQTPWNTIPEDPAYLSDMLTLYRRCRKDERTDCRFILQLCTSAFESVLHSKEKEETVHESSDCNRPVPAVR